MNYFRMNTTFLFVMYLGFSTIVFASCKSKKNALPITVEENMPTTESSTKIENINYHLVLSFYSIGSGADWDVIAEYDKFLELDKAASTQQAKVDRVTWGREGEVDFCIDLSNLSENRKKTFIAQSIEIANKAKYVHIKENAPCRNKR